MVPKPLRRADDNAPALLQLLYERYGMFPRNIVFVEVVHAKAPYVHHDRYDVTVFQKDAGAGSIVSVTVKFGFLEDPNVERILAELASHHQINLPADPHKWIVHVSLENLIPAAKTSLAAPHPADALLVPAARVAAGVLLVRPRERRAALRRDHAGEAGVAEATAGLGRGAAGINGDRAPPPRGPDPARSRP